MSFVFLLDAIGYETVSTSTSQGRFKKLHPGHSGGLGNVQFRTMDVLWMFCGRPLTGSEWDLFEPKMDAQLVTDYGYLQIILLF